MWWLLAIGGLNAVISLFYYLRVIKTLTIDPEPEDRLPDSFPMPWSATIFTLAVSLPTIVLFFSNDLIRWSSSAAAHLFS
jgi:NADH:ubiquinone oxidoreductase subunit 2 (subunit N)